MELEMETCSVTEYDQSMHTNITHIQNFRLKKYTKSQYYNLWQLLSYMYVTGMLIWWYTLNCQQHKYHKVMKVVSCMSVKLRMSSNCVYLSDNRKSSNAAGAGNRSSWKGKVFADWAHCVNGHTETGQVHKVRCKNQHASSFTRKNAGHENAKDAPSSRSPTILSEKKFEVTSSVCVLPCFN